MSKEVRLLDVDSFYHWDRFVLAHPQGSPFHLTRWQDLIVKNFRHTPYYLYRKCDGELTGVLPLVHVRSPLLGSVLVSTPYAVYGGMIANTEEDRLKIFEAAKDLAAKLNIKHIEFRNREPSEFDLPSVDLYHTFIKEIPEEEEECLLMIPRK
ncbi:MAG: peptidoglycan bridge formation protein FemAB, partial [Planctomycetota bacterium]